MGIVCAEIFSLFYWGRYNKKLHLYRARDDTCLGLIDDPFFQQLFLRVLKCAAKADIAAPYVLITDQSGLHAGSLASSKDDSIVFIAHDACISFSESELEAIIGHEVAHIAYERHLLWDIWFAVIRSSGIFYLGYGFFLYLLLFELNPLYYFFFICPLMAWMTLVFFYYFFRRRLEFRADKNGVYLTGDPHSAVVMLEKFYELEQEEAKQKTVEGKHPVSDSFFNAVSVLFHTHPPILQRIETLKQEFLKEK